LALVADIFIVLGLVYLYYYDIYTIAAQHGVADIKNFNSQDWTLFIEQPFLPLRVSSHHPNPDWNEEPK